MRRFWLGAALLAALLGVGLWTQAGMDRLHLPAAEDFSRAASAAMAGDWETARSLSARAAGNWRENRSFTASLADHSPMDEVDLLLAEMEIYRQAEDGPHFAACCVQLAAMSRAMADAHNLSWWNLL